MDEEIVEFDVLVKIIEDRMRKEVEEFSMLKVK
jgi:hypothetical protein